MTVREEINEILNRQESKGLSKYGVLLDGANLDSGKLVEHAIEEVADLLQYLVALRRRILYERARESATDYRLHQSDMQILRLLEQGHTP